MHEHSNSVRYTLDAAAGVTAIAAWADYLPKMAAALSVIWLLIQLTEWAVRKINTLRAR